MGLGTVLAQLINIVAQPVLTRLIPAESLGIYTYIVSMATMIIPVASLKLDMLIVSEEDDREAQYITDICVYINIIISLIYFLVIALGFNFPGENIFNKYGMIIFLVPLLVFTNGIRFLFISYNNRYKRYKLISSIAILREAARAIIQVGAGFLSMGAGALSMGYALSPVFGLHLQMKSYLKKLKERKLANWVKTKEIVFKKGKRQILYLVPAQFINSFSSSLITISITALFSSEILGYYSAGVRILDIPIIFITSNVSKVCYQKISEDVLNKKPILKLFLSVMFVLLIVSAVGFTLLYMIAPQLSGIVFGSGYEIAGQYIRCLCIMYAIRLVATSFAGVYTIFNKQNFEFFLNVLLIGVALFSYILTEVFAININVYLWSICIGYAMVYIVMLAGYIFLCYRYDKQLNNI